MVEPDVLVMVIMKSMTDSEWKKRLTKEQYEVLRKKGTERPFTGALLKNNDKGTYLCSGCGAELFDSEKKFDSGTGWPSFYDVKNSRNVELHEDSSHGMKRIEVTCKKCGSHLGHVFDESYGRRYCINSCALDFREEK